MKESFLPSKVKAGDTISAAHTSRVYQFVKSHSQKTRGFSSSTIDLTRPAPRTVAGKSAEIVPAVLTGNVPPGFASLHTFDDETGETEEPSQRWSFYFGQGEVGKCWPLANYGSTESYFRSEMIEGGKQCMAVQAQGQVIVASDEKHVMAWGRVVNAKSFFGLPVEVDYDVFIVLNHQDLRAIAGYADNVRQSLRHSNLELGPDTEPHWSDDYDCTTS